MRVIVENLDRVTVLIGQVEAYEVRSNGGTLVFRLKQIRCSCPVEPDFGGQPWSGTEGHAGMPSCVRKTDAPL